MTFEQQHQLCNNKFRSSTTSFLTPSTRHRSVRKISIRIIVHTTAARISKFDRSDITYDNHAKPASRNA